MSREWYIKLALDELDEPLGTSEVIKRTRVPTRAPTAIEDNTLTPCADRGDGKQCEHYAHCAVKRTACKAFYTYTRTKYSIKDSTLWTDKPKIPTKKWFRKTFNPK